MRWTPHALDRGLRRSARTRSAPRRCYIYIRGEFTEPLRRSWSRRVEEAYAAGILGKNAMGTGKRIDVHVHNGAGAYICGEETALMNSLEGKRGNPRIKPPFPAVAGRVRHADDDQQRRDARRGAAHPQQRRRLVQGDVRSATRRAPAPSSSRSAATCSGPATTRSTMGFPFKEFLYDLCGGPPPGRKLKAVIPGGSSVPILTREEAEAALMDYEGVVAQGLDARLGRRDRDGRRTDMVYADRAAGALLRPRELRAVHASAAKAPRGRPRSSSASWPGQGTQEDLDTLLLDLSEQHDRQDDLRAQRFLRGAGRERDPEVPRASSRRYIAGGEPA